MIHPTVIQGGEEAFSDFQVRLAKFTDVVNRHREGWRWATGHPGDRKPFDGTTDSGDRHEDPDDPMMEILWGRSEDTQSEEDR